MHERFPLPDLGYEPLRPFWDGAAAGELHLPRCGACGRLVWYPGGSCRRCGGSYTWTIVDPAATLFTWVVVRHAFLPAFADQVPFVTALVALDEDPSVRLATRLVDAEPADLRADMPVEVVFRPLRFTGVEGEVVAPLYRPAARVPA